MSAPPFGERGFRFDRTHFPQIPRCTGLVRKMRRKGQPEENVAQHVGRIGNLLLLPIILNG